jgi:hypothetical protein
MWQLVDGVDVDRASREIIRDASASRKITMKDARQGA